MVLRFCLYCAVWVLYGAGLYGAGVVAYLGTAVGTLVRFRGRRSAGPWEGAKRTLPTHIQLVYTPRVALYDILTIMEF